MLIKTVNSRYGNDFFATILCEFCGQEEKNFQGYHDTYFMNEVMPNMKCQKCHTSSRDSLRWAVKKEIQLISKKQLSD